MYSSVPLVQARPFHHRTILLGVQDMTPLGLTGILRCSGEVGNQGTIRGNPRKVFLSNISLLPYTPWVWCQCPLSDVLLGTKINWCFSRDSAALTHMPQISVAQHNESLFLTFAKSNAHTPAAFQDGCPPNSCHPVDSQGVVKGKAGSGVDDVLHPRPGSGTCCFHPVPVARTSHMVPPRCCGLESGDSCVPRRETK